MVKQDNALLIMVVLILMSIFIRTVLSIYYRDGQRILPKLKLSSSNIKSVSYYKKFDTAFAPLPFIYCWFEISAAVLFFRWTNFNVFAGMLLTIIASGRMRALQELGHNALHNALCRSKKLQWFLSNALFQFPTLKRDMDSRFIGHVREHHPNADIPGKDPNLKRVIAAGMVPGISKTQFIKALFYPVSPKGFINNIKGNFRDVTKENGSHIGVLLLRIVVTVLVVALFLWLGGTLGLLVGWLLPVVATYPLFAWWSLLSKHRWHTEYTPTRNRLAHDYEHGRATDFSGISGLFQRYLIFPMSDAYHLAHHIYPSVRYQYLPAVDYALKIHEPMYTQYISNGMIFGSKGQPAALSELYHRLVVKAKTKQNKEEF